MHQFKHKKTLFQKLNKVFTQKLPLKNQLIKHELGKLKKKVAFHNFSKSKMIELNIKGELRKKSFGITLDNFNYSTQLCICVAAIFSLYIGYGYCQEWIFQDEKLKQAGIFVTLIQFFFYTIFGLLEKSCSRIVGRKTPMSSYYILSLLTIATMGLSNASLGYLNYPTQVIFKSSKLIPVMIGGVIIQGKRYGVLDVASCLLMTIGVVSFTAVDFTVLPKFHPAGVLLISGALCADAAIGNYQELCLKKYKSSNAEMVLYSYGIGFLLLLIGNVLVQPALTTRLLFHVLYNPQVLSMIFAFSLTGYLGILFVLHLVRTFGALLAVTVTTCRKALTIVLSFVFFSKPFTIWYLFAGLLVVCGIGVNFYSKQQRRKREQGLLPM